MKQFSAKDIAATVNPDSDRDFYAYEIKSQCQGCIHWSPERPVVCEAFPEGIPPVILLNIFDHTHPYDIEGVSDNGITFQAPDA